MSRLRRLFSRRADPRGAYAPHEALVAPARRGRTGIGRLVLGALVIEVLFLLSLSATDSLVARIAPQLASEMILGDSAPGLILQLASYGTLALCTALVVRHLHHRRDWQSLLGPWPAFRRMGLAALAGAGLFYIVLQVLPPWTDFIGDFRVTSLPLWLVQLPFALLALLAQTGAEEVYYRGYLQQQIAARFRRPVVWMVAPNLMFAMAHWADGASVIDNGQYMIWAFVFGVACSDLVARSGSLGPAVGLHLANNAYAFLFFGEENALDSGLALILYPSGGGGYLPPEPTRLVDPQLLFELALIWLAWLAARVAIRR